MFINKRLFSCGNDFRLLSIIDVKDLETNLFLFIYLGKGQYITKARVRWFRGCLTSLAVVIRLRLKLNAIRCSIRTLLSIRRHPPSSWHGCKKYFWFIFNFDFCTVLCTFFCKRRKMMLVPHQSLTHFVCIIGPINIPFIYPPHCIVVRYYLIYYPRNRIKQCEKKWITVIPLVDISHYE